MERTADPRQIAREILTAAPYYYRLKPGIKFGGDYIAYLTEQSTRVEGTGSKEQYTANQQAQHVHSEYIIHAIHASTKITSLDLIRMGRGANAVKKKAIVVDSEGRLFKIEWKGGSSRVKQSFSNTNVSMAICNDESSS